MRIGFRLKVVEIQKSDPERGRSFVTIHNPFFLFKRKQIRGTGKVFKETHLIVR